MNSNDLVNIIVGNARPFECIDVILNRVEKCQIRFANSKIISNALTCNEIINLRIIINNRCGIASTNIINKQSILELIDTTRNIAAFTPQREYTVKLPGKFEYDNKGSMNRQNIPYSTSMIINDINDMIGYAKPLNLDLAGIYSVDQEYIRIANSNGCNVEMDNTMAELSVTSSSELYSGKASIRSPNIIEINPLDIVKEASDRALLSRDQTVLYPGEYEVVLLDYAVADLVKLISLGFCVESEISGSSWVTGRIGDKVFSDKINLIDDPFDPRNNIFKADYEGYPKSRIDLIKSGVPMTMICNCYYGQKTGYINTGHSLPFGSGTSAENLVMLPGDSSVDKMIKNVKHGVFISRLWYVNHVKRELTTFTGMTRDGFFLIEDGEITKALKNMRINDSVIKILSNVLEISQNTSNRGGVIVPSIRCSKINLTF